MEQSCENGRTGVIRYFVEAAVSTRALQLIPRSTCHSLYGWFVAATYLVSAGANLNGQYDEHGMHTNTPLDAAV